MGGTEGVALVSRGVHSQNKGYGTPLKWHSKNTAFKESRTVYFSKLRIVLHDISAISDINDINQ